MARDNLRRQIAFEAARALYARDESDYFRAKMKAARRVYGGDFRPTDLPTNREVRAQIEEFARADHRELNPDELGPQQADCGRPTDQPPKGGTTKVDRFHLYATLLAPLETIKESREAHPEGDLLYHSLQVFALAREQLPYDEEFLLAALLHDVGKAIDPRDHVGAALEALNGFITPRTAWLIAHHNDALALDDQALGVRSRRRLQASASFDELMLLARCDRAGRREGVPAPDLHDALQYLRELEEMCGE